MEMKGTLLFILLITAICLLSPLTAVAGEDGKFSDALSYNLKALAFGTAQFPAHSTQNPDNAFLNLYRYSTEIDLRPDFFLDLPDVSGLFKPRVIASSEWWEDGEPKGNRKSSDRTFVNEWRVQAKASPTVFVSFGKEKLLWGPSFLASPSNILFKDTEKINPKTEVEGKYLAKVIYVPTSAITINLISETEKEDNSLGEPLKPLQALKADYLGSNALISVIAYYRQHDRFRLGSYGQWTASDALLLYYDGIVSKGTDALYPVLDVSHPLGGAFVNRYDDSDRFFTTMTAGGSYTFLAGPTFSMEFLYNGQGYDNADADAYYSIRRNAYDHFFDNTPLSGLSQMTLNETLNNELPFLRRYYLMGQFQVREIKNVLDVIVRYTHGIEEHAGQASSIIGWQVSNRVEVFNINTVALGRGRDSEFNSLFTGSYMAGIEVHF
jgi:hypothetical protein